MLQRSIPGFIAIIAILTSSAAVSVVPGPGWKDSYSVNGQCYCITTYDHGAGVLEVETPAGIKTVVEICETIGPGPGVGDNPVYNDVQCGNGPANDAYDETVCPGRVDMGEAGCSIIGPSWNLDQYFTAPETESGGETTEETSEETTAGTTNPSQPPEPAPEGLLFEAESSVSADSRWYESTTNSAQQDTSSDPDANHSATAGNTTYLELLPDTLVVSGDAITSDNQWTEPGYGPILQYEINVPAAGIYAIAVRGYATGEFDRKIHAGVDGLWTTSGANITLCETDRWSWSNCGSTSHTVEFNSAGVHQLMFSAADDGFELDQFVLSPLADVVIDEVTTTTTQPPLAQAVSVGSGVAFGAAVGHGFLFIAGFVLLLRRRITQQ